MKSKTQTFFRFSLVLLIYNIFVIIFGAFVRATGSGAGCGAHWPLCNGEIVPRAPMVETIIEFTHRITSGITLVLAVILVLLAYRWFTKESKVRLAALLVLIFTIIEALIGAGLVLFELVAENDSLVRVIAVGLHLVNTYLLLGSNVLTVEWSRFGAPDKKETRKVFLIFVALLTIGMLFIGASGAVTALGDTLFPADSLEEGIRAEFSPGSHLLLRLRVYHPFIAVLVGIGLYFFIRFGNKKVRSERGRKYLLALSGLFVTQIFAGGINVLLLAPVWMQMLHLLLADFVWIFFVLTVNNLWGNPYESSWQPNEPSSS